MVYSIIKRCIWTLPVLFGIVVITFALIYKIPGDPVMQMVGERSNPETITMIRNKYGFDKPLHKQFFIYINQLLHGDMGISIIKHKKITESLIERFPVTVQLSSYAMILAILIGIPIGIISAVYRGKFPDHILMPLSLLGISTPVFWFGIMVMLLFSRKLNLLPASGYGDGALAYAILPSLTLGIRPAAFIARLLRTQMLDVMNEVYIQAARAKGLPGWKVILKHALRNAFIPVLHLIGMDIGNLLSGAALTEMIFGWPGIGSYALNAIGRRDYPVIMGTVIFTALIFVIVNLIVDILTIWIDPRIQNV